MATITNQNDIKQLGTIMFVGAHPDDESFTSAGLLSAAVSNNQIVVCVTATMGEKGVQDESRWPVIDLADIRTAEMEQVMQLIGVKYYHCLGYSDGHCVNVSIEEAVSKIDEFIDKYHVDTIITFGPDGLSGHVDHQTVSGWVNQAVLNRGDEVSVYQVVQPKVLYEYMKEADEKYDIFFNIDEPPLVDEITSDIYFTLSPDLSDKKFSILTSMPSQYDKLIQSYGKDFVCEITCIEAFTKVK